jgi:hypothetical protein
MTYYNSESTRQIPLSNRMECGTTACAAGHGPLCGIKSKRGETWNEYTERVFGLTFMSPEWHFCFSSRWDSIDNTIKGASKRLIYFLNHGAPNYFNEPNATDVSLYENCRPSDLDKVKSYGQ